MCKYAESNLTYFDNVYMDEKFNLKLVPIDTHHSYEIFILKKSLVVNTANTTVIR